MRLRVRDLDADGPLAGDRGEDADVGRGQRVGEVVLELGDLADLGPGRELQLVAADVRAGDGADQLRLDPEVAERLEQRLGGPLHVAAVGAAVARLGDVEQLLRRQLVVDLVRLGDSRRASRPSASSRSRSRPRRRLRRQRLPGRPPRRRRRARSRRSCRSARPAPSRHPPSPRSRSSERTAVASSSSYSGSCGSSYSAIGSDGRVENGVSG